MTRSRTLCSWILCVLALAGTDAPAARAQEQDQPEPTNELVDRIVRSDDAEAQDAIDRLVDEAVRPFAARLGDLHDRPPQQRLRMWAAVDEVTAGLRLAAFETMLPPPDRALLRSFAAENPHLARPLFYEDAYEREAALGQLPLRPNTGASVLIAALSYDSDEGVASAAGRLAMQLKDPVIVRVLERYLRDVMTLVADGYFGPGEEDLELMVGVAVYRAIAILGAADAKQTAPLVLKAVEHFAGKFDPRLLDVGPVFVALGRLGDERVAPLLLKYLDAGMIIHARTNDEVTVFQSVGDAALLGLLELYGAEPGRVGFVEVGSGPWRLWGFPTDAIRQKAHRAFRGWYDENAAKPPDQRSVLPDLRASEPAESPQPPETPEPRP